MILDFSGSTIINEATESIWMSGISMFNNFAGFIVNIDSAVIKSIKSCLTKLKVSGNRVSNPHAPTEADENGNNFVSFDLGKWFDVITSIIPSLIASAILSLSSSFLNGGESLNEVL